jgi:hypothetical protein
VAGGGLGEQAMTKKEKTAAYQREYRRVHSKKLRIQSRAYRKAHARELKLKSAAYYRTHAKQIGSKKAAYYKTNSEKIRTKRASYYRTNIERFKAKSRAYNKAHRKEKRVRDAAYRKANLKKILRKEAEYRKAHRKEITARNNAYAQRRCLEDPDYRMRHRLRARIRLALRGKKKMASTLELVGCSVEFLRAHLQKLFKKGMAWENYGVKGWHVDHIRPCASFDLSDLRQQRQCFHYTNLQPLWWWENIQKGDKMPA